jgi:PAS domain S-box-containing protein
MFVVAAIALLAISGLCAIAVAAYANATARADQTLEIRRQIYEWRMALVDAETGVRGYIASGDPVFLEPYQGAVASERNRAEILRTLVAEVPAKLSRFTLADRAARDAMAHLAELVVLVRNGHRDQALATLSTAEGKRHMDSFRAAVEAMRAAEAAELGASESRAHGAARLWWAASVPLGLFGCGLLLAAWRRERSHERAVTGLADGARTRLQALSQVTAALAEARTRAQVASVVVEQVVRVTEADTCTLYELDAAGEVLELTADRGVAPEVLAKIRRISATAGNPEALTSMREGRSIYVEDQRAYARMYPDLVETKSDKPRACAFWSVPLIAEGQPRGLLGVGYYNARSFGPDERTFIETLSRHCAQGLLRAARMEREDEARSWLTTTLRSIGDGVIATDAAGKVSFMNPVAEHLTGWPAADARHRPLEEVFQIFSEQTRQTVESPVTKVLREGKVVGLANHTLLRSRQGVERPIEDSGAPIRSDDGVITGVVLAFRDGSDEKRARVRREFLARAGEALVSSLEYEAILATVARFAVPTIADWCAVDLLEPGAEASRQVAVAHIDEDKVRFARELGERYPPDPHATTGVPEVIRSGRSELYPEIPTELIERAARDEEHRRLLHALQLESAMVVPLSVRGRTFGAISFIYAESGRRYTPEDLSFAEDFARRAAMAIENTLVLKDAEAARAREQALRSEAELANRAKDEFLATVSHELRTPLTSVLGWVTVLRRRNPPPDMERGLITIERNARLQAKLIDDVLDISRIISGKLVLNIERIDLNEIVRASIETVMPTADLKGVGVTVELPAEPLRLFGDAARLQQVLWNLLANAVKFTSKGGKVTVEAGQVDSEVWVSVRDTGEGIRRSHLPALFERFRQADSSTTRRHGGLGLGLAIVRQLVVAHGGTVHADSAGEGKGATFTIRLPGRAIVPALAAATPTPAFGTKVEGHPTDVQSLVGTKILLVDDERDALDLLRELLTEEGARVHAFSSAREALAGFAGVRPDVVVSDIGMPEMDGFALIQRIRALPPADGGATPAIALTAFARTEDINRTLAAGYQIHLAKPIEIARFIEAITSLVQKAPPAPT